MDEKLREVREWAQQKITSGQEPPWAWYQYMKLIETVDAILAGGAAVTRMDCSQQSASHSGTRLRLVGSTYQPDSAQPHQADVRPQMPM